MTAAATFRHASPAIQQRSAGSRLAVSEFNALFRLAGPIAAVGLLNMGMSLTDVIMVGWLGADALAAVAVMSDAYSIVFYLAAGILAATVPLIAHARGPDDRPPCGKRCATGSGRPGSWPFPRLASFGWLQTSWPRSACPRPWWNWARPMAESWLARSPSWCPSLSGGRFCRLTSGLRSSCGSRPRRFP